MLRFLSCCRWSRDRPPLAGVHGSGFGGFSVEAWPRPSTLLEGPLAGQVMLIAVAIAQVGVTQPIADELLADGGEYTRGDLVSHPGRGEQNIGVREANSGA